MDGLFTLIAIAILIEGLITYGQTVYSKGSIQWQIVIAFIIGIVFCYDAGLNFFSMLGLVEQWPIVGTVATAVILSRGSNYMFEFYHQLTSWRKQVEENTNQEG